MEWSNPKELSVFYEKAMLTCIVYCDAGLGVALLRESSTFVYRLSDVCCIHLIELMSLELDVLDYLSFVCSGSTLFMRFMENAEKLNFLTKPVGRILKTSPPVWIY